MVKRGYLSVIAGPMFAGKSSSLLQQVLWLEHNQKKTLVIKPHIDDRYDPENIVTHDQLRHRCVSAIDLELVKDNYNIKPYNFNTVFIDVNLKIALKYEIMAILLIFCVIFLSLLMVF